MGLQPPIDNDKPNGIEMSLRQISTRIELSFWQVAISLLSGSSFLQRLIRWFYLTFLPFSAKFINRFERPQVYRWAGAGLGLGFIIGLMIAVF